MSQILERGRPSIVGPEVLLVSELLVRWAYRQASVHFYVRASLTAGPEAGFQYFSAPIVSQSSACSGSRQTA